MLRKVRFLMISISILTVNLIASSAQDLESSFKYIYPVPEAKMISPKTGIILKPHEQLITDPNLLTSIATITGTESGKINYRTLILDDKRIITLKPDKSFMPGETVTVSLNREIKTKSDRLTSTGSFSFTISSNTPES